MAFTIPDDILKQAGLTEREALIEFACRLFDADKLDLFTAGRLAGLSRVELENELRARRIAPYRPTAQDILDDVAALKRMGA